MSTRGSGIQWPHSLTLRGGQVLWVVGLPVATSQVSSEVPSEQVEFVDQSPIEPPVRRRTPP